MAAELRKKINNLLNERAIRLFLFRKWTKAVVTKKRGELLFLLFNPSFLILDNWVLNRFLLTYIFKMLTLRQLPNAISPGDWSNNDWSHRCLLSCIDTSRWCAVSEVWPLKAQPLDTWYLLIGLLLLASSQKHWLWQKGLCIPAYLDDWALDEPNH